MASELSSIGRSSGIAANAATPRARDSHPLLRGCCGPCDSVFASLQSGGEAVKAAIARPVQAGGRGAETRTGNHTDDEARSGVIVRLSSSGKVVKVDPAAEKAGKAEKAEKADATGKTDAEHKATATGDEKLEDHEVREVEQLEDRDREVRAHEQAHKAAAGQHGGAVSLSYKTGPDGKRYAVSGEVPVDLSPISNDPSATVRKMTQIRQAALAPADPSSADRAAAARAMSLQQKAQADLAELQTKRMEQAGGPVKTDQQLQKEAEAESKGRGDAVEKSAPGAKTSASSAPQAAQTAARAPTAPEPPKTDISSAAAGGRTSLNFYA
jgi:hypothetical protein